MAGSRVYLSGSVFQRVSGLLKSGAVHYEHRPVWYDVCAAFPPKIEPRSDRILSDKDVTNIIYPEDVGRATFFDSFDSSECVINMVDKSAADSISEKFSTRYLDLNKVMPSADEAFTKTIDSLIADGLPKLKLKESESRNVVRLFETHKQMWDSKRDQVTRKPTVAEAFGDKLAKSETAEVGQENGHF